MNRRFLLYLSDLFHMKQLRERRSTLYVLWTLNRAAWVKGLLYFSPFSLKIWTKSKSDFTFLLRREIIIFSAGLIKKNCTKCSWFVIVKLILILIVLIFYIVLYKISVCLWVYSALMKSFSLARIAKTVLIKRQPFWIIGGLWQTKIKH